jgi:signal transduction histidine kinase
MVAIADTAPAWVFPVLVMLTAALISGAVLVAWLLVQVRSIKTQQQAKEQEHSAAKLALQEQTEALLEAEKKIARLKQIPEAELLPMLQLTHELRSPLAAIQNSLEMVLQGYTRTNPELHDEMLALAQERAMTMLGWVNDFLRIGSVQYAKIARRPQPVQLLNVWQRLASEMAVRAKWRSINLHIDLPDALPLINATSEDLEHMLANLVSNALKYTDPGGDVTLVFRTKANDVVIVVEDTGIGIASDEIPKIFDDFYRAESAKDKAHGTGLGLSIVKRVVDIYGGEIHVESELGQGSRFTLVFPAIQDAQKAAL